MMDITAPGVRFLIARGGCFGGAIAIAAFTPSEISVIDAQRAMRHGHPEIFKGSDCETCGYDFPEFSENPAVDEDAIHRHSPDSCGQEPGFGEKERIRALWDYNFLEAVDAEEYMEILAEENPEALEDAPVNGGAELESWIADQENYLPSSHCEYDITYSLDEVLGYSDATITDFYALDRNPAGKIDITALSYVESPLRGLRAAGVS